MTSLTDHLPLQRRSFGLWTLVFVWILDLGFWAFPSAAAAAEKSGIAAIGLDWRALLFQIINFTILLILLRLFAYKPILNILEQRRTRISLSLQQAEEIGIAKNEMTTTKDRLIAEAHLEAQRIVAAGKKQSADLIRAADVRAADKTDKAVEQAHAKIAQDVAAARSDLKKEMFSLVALATEKIARVKLDEKKDHELIEETIQQSETRN